MVECLSLNLECLQFVGVQNFSNFTILFTVKFLNFRTPETFAVIYLKFKQKAQTSRVFRQKDVNGIAISEDSNQTLLRGVV